MPCSLFRTLILVVLFFYPAASFSGEAPWYVSYENALRAQERGDWKASLTYLEDAVAEKPQGQLKARTYGLWYVDYLPHYHMGIAYARLEEKDDALRQLSLEEQDGAILKAPEQHEHLKRLKAELLGEGVRPPVAEKKDTARQALKPADATRPLAADATADVEPGDVAWYASYDAALAYMESRDWIKAVEGLKAAVESRSAPSQYARTYGMWFVTYVPYYYLGTCYYNQALWQFAVKYFELSEKMGELSGMNAEQSVEADLLTKAKRRAAQQGTKPVPRGVREMLTAEIADAVRLYNLQRYEEAEDGFRTILQLDPYNSVARAYMEKLAGSEKDVSVDATAKGDFLAGTFEYYKGNYDSAIALFRSAQPGFDQDASFYAFLGAALCEKAGKSEQSSSSVLQEAREAFARVLDLDPGYRLDRRVFPKRVLEIFRSVQERRNQK